jgi:hypothetical protein
MALSKNMIWFMVIGVVALFAVVGFTLPGNAVRDGTYDAFAKCLTDNGTKMFGAYWCPHCKEQKKAFGSAWEHIDYIECSLPDGRGQTKFCSTQGIEGYPTWEFKDGSRLPGKVSMAQLSLKTGCSLE